MLTNFIAIVICNYNKKDFVVNCIKSVFDSNFKDFDLIVVDNASTDGSVEAINSEFSDKLTLLVNEENLGGSGGFARGMQFALDKGYKYIHLLDNDTIVDKNAISALYEFMEEHPEVGACGSLICRMDEKEIIQDYGAMIDAENLGVRPLHKGQKRDSSLPAFVECDYVAACSAFYRSSVIKKTGVFDKDYFIYWDDMSLSKEIWLADYKVCATAKSIVWHYHSISPTNTFSNYYFFRNKIHYFVKYMSDREFSSLPEKLVQRIFRTSATNRHNPQITLAYISAFDDVLNNMRGKAEAWKMQPNVATRTMPQNTKIINVPHVLDVGKYDRSCVYIDPWQNMLFGNEDFDFAENLDGHYKFFHDVFYEFVKNKLDALRKKIRVEEF
jgi:GT2 family glycosyltransferase